MKAIIHCADTGPLESLVEMLKSIDVDCSIPSDGILTKLRRLGHDTVISPRTLYESWGYEKPFHIDVADISEMSKSDTIFVDIKAHRYYNQFVREWPNLKNKVLWYRINGGMPEHVVNERGDHGNEVNPPCPILTPNQWYRQCIFCKGGTKSSTLKQSNDPFPCDFCKGLGDYPNSYCCYPPFHRIEEYNFAHGRPLHNNLYTMPVCFIHNINGWGYRDLVNNMRSLGVHCYGKGSPDGLIPHSTIPGRLSDTLAMVHLKSSDAPGYAIYECLASATPLICTRRLIWRCKMQDLLIPNETCLVFDRETHESLTPEDVEECTREVKEHLQRLRNVEENRRIGYAGLQRLQTVMWNKEVDTDVNSLRTFWDRHFKDY